MKKGTRDKTENLRKSRGGSDFTKGQDRGVIALELCPTSPRGAFARIPVDRPDAAAGGVREGSRTEME